jgi:GTP-binding protein
MQIKSAKFIKGITGTDEVLSNGKFQVAFMGRSNVGKSTLINSLCLKKSLARSSSSPGKTVRMDFFLINDKFYFVDFPGYGYAKHSSYKREKLAKMMLWYLMYSEVKNRLVMLVIDSKIGITAFDADMVKTLCEFKINHIIVANKIDNLKMNQKEKQLNFICNTYKNSPVIPYSSKQKYGRDALISKISMYYS